MAVVAPIVAAMVAIVGTPQIAFGASAVPVVLSFTASKTSISNSGGTMVLKAKLKYASSCKITVSRTLKGFPKSFSCASDSVSQSVTLPTNKGQNPVSYTFRMIVKNGAGSTPSTDVIVEEGAAPPPISFTTPPPGNPTTLIFAAEGVFVADDPLIVTVTNNSSTTQLITSVAIGTTGDPNDFILNRNNCGYITAHANCSLAVQFQPTGAGFRTGVVNIFDSSWGAAGTTASLRLEGTGIWATATVANANIRGNVLTFPIQYGVGTASPYQYVTLSNVGSVPLYISGITDTGGEYADFNSGGAPITSNCPQIVSVGQSCTFGVSFDPLGSGVRTTNIVIDDNTLGTQTQLQVQGTGVYSTDTLSINDDTPEPSPISYDFESAIVGGSAADATLTITNTSDVTLDFTGLSSTGINATEFGFPDPENFTTCAGPGNELAAGQSCSTEIDFVPAATGPRSATLRIGDNSPDGGEIITVSGTGTS